MRHSSTDHVRDATGGRPQSDPLCVGNLLMILGFAIALNGWAMYLVAAPVSPFFSPAMVIAAAWPTISRDDLRKNMGRPRMEPRSICRHLEYACPRLHVGENDDVRGYLATT